MTVIVDTGVVYAAHDTDATRHDAAASALKAVYKSHTTRYFEQDGFEELSRH